MPMEDVHMHKHEGASGLIRISQRLRTGERSNRKEVRWLPAQPTSQGDNVEDGAEDSRREERESALWKSTDKFVQGLQ